MSKNRADTKQKTDNELHDKGHKYTVHKKNHIFHYDMALIFYIFLFVCECVCYNRNEDGNLVSSILYNLAIHQERYYYGRLLYKHTDPINVNK